jgi:23S rRNA (uracil1939-C5)-methyltransferase
MKVFWEEVKDLLNPYQVIGFLQNVQPKRGNTILSEHWNLIAGTEEFKESDFGLNLYDTLASFTQVNLTGEKIIHKTLEDWLEAVKSKHMLDIYGGRGDFSFVLREKFQHKIIIEENHISVMLGKKIVKENALKNFEYMNDKAEKVIKEKVQLLGDFVAIVDPPRKGLLPDVIMALNDSPAVKLVYVSCDPVTLARDLKLLCANVYQIERISLIEMFPQTHHMETMVLLKRKS